MYIFSAGYMLSSTFHTVISLIISVLWVYNCLFYTEDIAWQAFSRQMMVNAIHSKRPKWSVEIDTTPLILYCMVLFSSVQLQLLKLLLSYSLEGK